MRSTFNSPVSLSSSYLTLETLGISIRAVNSSGASSPIGTSCQGWGILVSPSGEVIAGRTRRPRLYIRPNMPPARWLLTEVSQDGLVGLLVGHQDLFTVPQVSRVALQLVGGHLGVFAVDHQRPC